MPAVTRVQHHAPQLQSEHSRQGPVPSRIALGRKRRGFWPCRRQSGNRRRTGGRNRCRYLWCGHRSRSRSGIDRRVRRQRFRHVWRRSQVTSQGRTRRRRSNLRGLTSQPDRRLRQQSGCRISRSGSLHRRRSKSSRLRLSRLRLDHFRHDRPSGLVACSHRGQSGRQRRRYEIFFHGACRRFSDHSCAAHAAGRRRRRTILQLQLDHQAIGICQLRCRKLRALLQIENHARHSRLRLRDADLLQQPVAHGDHVHSLADHLRLGALDVEEQPVRARQAVRFVMEIRSNFDGDARHFAERPEAHCRDFTSLRAETKHGAGEASDQQTGFTASF